METHRLIKDYFFYPLIAFTILLTGLHWFDSQIRDFEQSISFGLKFATGFSVLIGLITVFGIKFVRPKLDKKFANHKILNDLKEHGFELNNEYNTYTGKIHAYDAQFYYGYEEMDILSSRYYIVIIFEPISKEKHKTLKPHRLFDNTFIGKNHMIGYHEFKIRPPKTSDLIDDARAFCAYLKNHGVKPER